MSAFRAAPSLQINRPRLRDDGILGASDEGLNCDLTSKQFCLPVQHEPTLPVWRLVD